MATINKPNSFSSNTTISSSEINDNFDTIYNEFNGNISSANLAASAISSTKIASSAITTDKINDTAVTPAKLDADLAAGWIDLGDTPDTVTANGNRSYDLVFNSNDLTDTVSEGMRLEMTRTVTAPTQCTDLEASSSQYWSKASPSGITFTDDFTVSAWIKLESYGTGYIVTRLNGTTEGWGLYVESDGTLNLIGRRIASNYRLITSYQSIPLNKWVHVAATMNNSSNTHTMYIDGVSVPFATTTTGTITALVQPAVDLVVGYRAGGGVYFDGKIAQVGLFDAVLDAATIRSYASQTLSGSETNCIGAWKFNGDGTDESANANDLTANGGAAATATDTPFAGGSVGTTEYGIVTAAAFSTNTTLTVQVPEGYAIPTSGGVSAVLYSTHSVPFGFPLNSAKWTLTYTSSTDRNLSTGVGTAWQGLTDALTIGIGLWEVSYSALLRINHNTSGTSVINIYSTLSADGSTETNTKLTTAVGSDWDSSGSSGFAAGSSVYNKENVVLTSQTTFTLLGSLSNAGQTSSGIVASSEIPLYIEATCAYL